MDRIIEDWEDPLLEDFLETWWQYRPGLYNLYFREFEGDEPRMIAALRDRQYTMFHFIWDNMVSSYLYEE